MSLLNSIGSLFTQPGVQAIAAGLLSGVIGGSVLVATGIVPLGGTRAAAPTVAVTACPGSGAVLAEIPTGQALLATARSADGRWLQVYVSQPGVDRGWAPATALRLESVADGLPIADCTAPTQPPPSPADPSATAAPSPSPSATVAATESPMPTLIPSPTPTATIRATAKPTPTPSPKPAPTPSPTPTPDTTAPMLSNLTTTGFPYNGQYYIYGPSAPCTPRSATISVTATDAGGLQSVNLYYWPGGAAVSSTPMAPVGSNVWQATIAAQDSWSVGLINYWVRAVDSSGNEAQLDHSNAYSLLKGDCIT